MVFVVNINFREDWNIYEVNRFWVLIIMRNLLSKRYESERVIGKRSGISNKMWVLGEFYFWDFEIRVLFKKRVLG